MQWRDGDGPQVGSRSPWGNPGVRWSASHARPEFRGRLRRRANTTDVGIRSPCTTALNRTGRLPTGTQPNRAELVSVPRAVPRRIVHRLSELSVRDDWSAEALTERFTGSLGVVRAATARPLVDLLPAGPHDTADPVALVARVLADLPAVAEPDPGSPSPSPRALRADLRPHRPWRFGVPELQTSAELARRLDLTTDELAWFADTGHWLRHATPPLRHYVAHLQPTAHRGARLVRRPSRGCGRSSAACCATSCVRCPPTTWPTGLFPAAARSPGPPSTTRYPVLVRADLVARRLDVRLAGLARTLRYVVTRYANDLVLPGPTELDVGAGLFALGRLIADEGFALHPAETTVDPAHTRRRRRLGLVVNDTAGVARHERDALRAPLHHGHRTGPAAQNHDGHPDFRAHLQGRISWVAAGHPARLARLRTMLEAITW